MRGFQPVLPVLESGGIIFSRPTVLDVPNSPIFSNAFRKTDYHFDHIDVIQGFLRAL